MKGRGRISERTGNGGFGRRKLGVAVRVLIEVGEIQGGGCCSENFILRCQFLELTLQMFVIGEQSGGVGFQVVEFAF